MRVLLIFENHSGFVPDLQVKKKNFPKIIFFTKKNFVEIFRKKNTQKNFLRKNLKIFQDERKINLTLFNSLKVHGKNFYLLFTPLRGSNYFCNFPPLCKIFRRNPIHQILSEMWGKKREKKLIWKFSSRTEFRPRIESFNLE